MQNQLERTDHGKPILQLKEHDTIDFIGEELVILEDEQKICEKLEKDYKTSVLHTTNPNRIRISPHWFVGAMEFDKFILNISPKFVEFENLGRLIDFVYDVESEFDDEIRFQSEIDQPIEFVIRSFLGICQKLIKRGLHRSYELQHENVSFLKGKLIMKQQIQNDLKFNMKFNCEFDEFTADNLENQIILYTLRLCKKLTKFRRRKIFIQKLIRHIDSQVQDKQISVNDFGKIAYTRLNSKYEKPHELAKLIIQNIGFHNLKYQKTRFIVPFFVPMPDLFEKFLEILFSNYYELDIKSQSKHRAWYKDGTYYKKIQPDIISIRNNEINSIIDAKYMTDVKEEQMYQIAFYLNELKKETGYAILPHENLEDYELTVPAQNITIKVKHININQILDTFYSKNKSHKEIKEWFSSKLKELVPII